MRKSATEKEDPKGMKCEICGLKKLSVSYREDGYAQDVGNNPTAMHTVCDECEYQCCQDI